MKLLIGFLSLFIAVSAIATSDPTGPQLFNSSARRTLGTNPPPIITQMPVSQIITQGETATFFVSAALPSRVSRKGSKPQLRYQWAIRAPGGTTTNIISTETNSTLTIPQVEYLNQGQYIAIVSYTGSIPVSVMATLTVPTTNILSGCKTTNNSVGVRWDYNLADDLAVNKFRVYYGVNSSSLTSTQLVAAPQLATTISNLLSANTYFIQATAVNTNGSESPKSNQISYGFGYGCNGVPFTIDIMMLTNNIPRLCSKLCPNCSVTIYRSTNLVNWITVGATVADQYGNIMFDDHNAPANYGFYRMSTNP